MLRYEAPSPVQARYVAHDTECRGQTITQGSIMLLLNGSANRDESQFPDGERFDIHRGGGHLSFGQGLHFCMGSALARMQTRVAFEEVLRRWPDWEVDYPNAAKAHTASVRGWGKPPVIRADARLQQRRVAAAHRDDAHGKRRSDKQTLGTFRRGRPRLC